MTVKLSIKQEAFVQAYIKTGNASEAYRQAGYSGGSAKTINEAASRLLKNSKVGARIASFLAKQEKRFEITQDRWLAEYASLGFSDLSAVTEWDPTTGITIKASKDLSPNVKAAVQSIEQTQNGLKIKLHDKKGALDAIGKHFGWFKEDNKQKGEAEAAALAEVVPDIRDLARVLAGIFSATQLTNVAGTAAGAAATEEPEDED